MRIVLTILLLASLTAHAGVCPVFLSELGDQGHLLSAYQSVLEFASSEGLLKKISIHKDGSLELAGASSSTEVQIASALKLLSEKEASQSKEFRKKIAALYDEKSKASVDKVKHIEETKKRVANTTTIKTIFDEKTVELPQILGGSFIGGAGKLYTHEGLHSFDFEKKTHEFRAWTKELPGQIMDVIAGKERLLVTAKRRTDKKNILSLYDADSKVIHESVFSDFEHMGTDFPASIAPSGKYLVLKYRQHINAYYLPAKRLLLGYETDFTSGSVKAVSDNMLLVSEEKFEGDPDQTTSVQMYPLQSGGLIENFSGPANLDAYTMLGTDLVCAATEIDPASNRFYVVVKNARTGQLISKTEIPYTYAVLKGFDSDGHLLMETITPDGHYITLVLAFQGHVIKLRAELMNVRAPYGIVEIKKSDTKSSYRYLHYDRSGDDIVRFGEIEYDNEAETE